LGGSVAQTAYLLTQTVQRFGTMADIGGEVGSSTDGAELKR
jgi:hypothetical protein